jgi:hypothetical protein
VLGVTGAGGDRAQSPTTLIRCGACACSAQDTKCARGGALMLRPLRTISARSSSSSSYEGSTSDEAEAATAHLAASWSRIACPADGDRDPFFNPERATCDVPCAIRHASIIRPRTAIAPADEAHTRTSRCCELGGMRGQLLQQLINGVLQASAVV